MAVCKTIVETSGHSPLAMKLEGTLNLDRHTANYAPTLAILFTWTWMRALQFDSKHGRFQRRAQVCFYGRTVSSDAKTKIGSRACLKGSANMAQSPTVAEKALRLASALAAVKTKIGSRVYLKGSTNLAPSLTVAEKVAPREPQAGAARGS